MSDRKAEAGGWFLAILLYLVYFAGLAAVVYIAIHFIVKYW